MADRPRKKKKQKSSGIGIVVIVLGSIGALLVLTVIISGAIWLSFRNRPDGRGKGDNFPQIVQDGVPKMKDPGAGLRDYYLKYDQARSRLTGAEGRMQQVMQQGQSFRPQLDEVRSVYNSIRAESSAWLVPENESAKQLHQCFQEYISLYESQIQWADQALAIRERQGADPLPPRPNKMSFDNKERELNRLASSVSRSLGP